MDQQREPDIYMMKVVTFGDKPASAIAQTALRLSAEEGESTHPEAATTLKKNVYMDDICDSVKSEKEAKNLLDHQPVKLGNNGRLRTLGVKIPTYCLTTKFKRRKFCHRLKKD